MGCDAGFSVGGENLQDAAQLKGWINETIPVLCIWKFSPILDEPSSLLLVGHNSFNSVPH